MTPALDRLAIPSSAAATPSCRSQRPRTYDTPESTNEQDSRGGSGTAPGLLLLDKISSRLLAARFGAQLRRGAVVHHRPPSSSRANDRRLAPQTRARRQIMCPPRGDRASYTTHLNARGHKPGVPMITLTATEQRLGIHDTSRLWRLEQPPAQARGRCGHARSIRFLAS